MTSEMIFKNKMSVLDSQKKLFDEAIGRVNMFLTVTGLDVMKQKPEQYIGWYSRRWFFYLNFLCVVYSVFSQIAWGIRASSIGALTLTQLTYLGPCLLLCVLGSTKSFNFFVKTPVSQRLIEDLKGMFNDIKTIESTGKQNYFYMQCHIKFLYRALNTLACLNGLGIIAFSIGPILILVFHYYTEGALNLQLPFMLFYPFDPFKIYTWPFAYVHQIWSAIVAVFTVLGPDSSLYTCCVLINVQFFYLKQEIELIFIHRTVSLDSNDVLKKKIADIVNRHRELLRCADLIETIHRESSLCNVLTSSLLICFTGFNVMAYRSFLIITPFILFLLMVVGQIYLLCYYGDLLRKSNAQLCDAVYNSAWYNVKAIFAKYMIIICARAQKPCKLTAYGFLDINMAAFTRIISTSWSYFALLLSLLKNN